MRIHSEGMVVKLLRS